MIKPINGALCASLLFLFLFAQPSLAATNATCIGNNFQNNTTVITNGIPNSTSEMVACANGCSQSLLNCRPDRFTESLLVLIIIASFVVFLWIASYMDVLVMFSIILSALVSAIIFVTDVFSDDLKTIFLIVPIAILAYGVMVAYQMYHKKNEDEMDEFV